MPWRSASRFLRRFISFHTYLFSILPIESRHHKHKRVSLSIVMIVCSTPMGFHEAKMVLQPIAKLRGGAKVDVGRKCWNRKYMRLEHYAARDTSAKSKKSNFISQLQIPRFPHSYACEAR